MVPGPWPLTPTPAPEQQGPNVSQVDGRVMVTINQDQGDLIYEARRALVIINQQPQLFRKGGALSRVGRDDKGRAVIIPLSAQAIRAVIADKIGWRKAVRDADGRVRVTPAGPPPIVVDDLFTRADELTASRCSIRS